MARKSLILDQIMQQRESWNSSQIPTTYKGPIPQKSRNLSTSMSFGPKQSLMISDLSKSKVAKSRHLKSRGLTIDKSSSNATFTGESLKETRASIDSIIKIETNDDGDYPMKA